VLTEEAVKIPNDQAVVGRRCEHCDLDARFGFEDRCRACNYPVAMWAPNVQLAAESAQADALDERYRQSRVDAERRGLLDAFLAFQTAARRTAAVVNMDAGLAFHFMTSEAPLYAPYASLVSGHARTPASFDDDRRRRAVDALIYGGAGERIVFGALSLDGRGLTSYGDVHVELKDMTIADRATVLEENSYAFVERRALTPDAAWPAGRLAEWAHRDKLVASKLGRDVQQSWSDVERAAAILHSPGNRAGDRFLEVHIYGTFNRQAAAPAMARRLGWRYIPATIDPAKLAEMLARLRDHPASSAADERLLRQFFGDAIEGPEEPAADLLQQLENELRHLLDETPPDREQE
jgi:hypothetical protein